MKRTVLIGLTTFATFLLAANVAVAQPQGTTTHQPVAPSVSPMHGAQTGDVDTGRVILSAGEIGPGWEADPDEEVTFSTPDNSSILVYRSWDEDVSPEGFETVSLQVMAFPSAEEARAFFDNPSDNRFEILDPPPMGDVSRLMYKSNPDGWHGAYMQSVKGRLWIEADATGAGSAPVTEKVQSLMGAMLQRVP